MNEETIPYGPALRRIGEALVEAARDLPEEGRDLPSMAQVSRVAMRATPDVPVEAVEWAVTLLGVMTCLKTGETPRTFWERRFAGSPSDEVWRERVYGGGVEADASLGPAAATPPAVPYPPCECGHRYDHHNDPGDPRGAGCHRCACPGYEGKLEAFPENPPLEGLEPITFNGIPVAVDPTIRPGTVEPFSLDKCVPLPLPCRKHSIYVARRALMPGIAWQDSGYFECPCPARYKLAFDGWDLSAERIR